MATRLTRREIMLLRSLNANTLRSSTLTMMRPSSPVRVTVGIEMLESQPDLDALVVAVGGGGLIAGIALAAKALKPSIEVVGVQMLRFPSMFNAVKHTSMPHGSSTIAEGIAVGTPGRITQQLIERHVDDIALVDEGDIEQAIVMLLEIEKSLVEGAGAAGLAALLKYPDRFVVAR